MFYKFDSKFQQIIYFKVILIITVENYLGHDTTANGLSMVFYTLARNKKAESRVLEEI